MWNEDQYFVDHIGITVWIYFISGHLTMFILKFETQSKSITTPKNFHWLYYKHKRSLVQPVMATLSSAQTLGFVLLNVENYEFY